MELIVGWFSSINVEWQVLIVSTAMGLTVWISRLSFKALRSRRTHAGPSFVDQAAIDLAGAGDFEGLMSEALRLIIDATGTDYNQVFLVSTSEFSKQLLCSARAVPSHKQDYSVVAFSGLLGIAISSGRTINVPDVRKRIGYLQAVLETRSELVVPIKIEGRVVGVINSESERVNHYDASVTLAIERVAAALGANLNRVGWHESHSATATKSRLAPG